MPSNIWKQTLNDPIPTASRVVVTGVGVVSPSVMIIKRLPTTSYRAPRALGQLRFSMRKNFDMIACEVKDFTPNFIDAKLSKRMDRFTHFGIVASDQAIKDANNLEGVNKDRTAVIWSSGIGGLGFFERDWGTLFWRRKCTL